MIRCFILFAFLCQVITAVATEPPVMPKFRLLMGETEEAYEWRETMTDGSVRDSIIAKPKPVPHALRVRLVATNDVGFAWRFDYEVGRSDGSTVTNASFQMKPPRERLADKLDLKRPEMPPMPQVPPAMEQFKDAKERAEKMKEVRERASEMALVQTAPMGVVTQRMERRVFTTESKMIGNDTVQISRTDGSILTQAVVRVVGARIAALDKMIAARAKAPEPEPDTPIDAGHAATAVGGVIVGALGAAAIKRKKVQP